MLSALALLSLSGLVAAQHPGPGSDNHPTLTTWKCTKDGGCVKKDTTLVLDSLSHPVYQINNPSQNCGNWGEAANPDACPDAETCQANCRMDSVQDYTQYGVFTDGDKLDLHQLVNGNLASPRVYLLDPDAEKYEMLQVTGGEFTFDVDMAKLPCGMNAAVCFMEMAEDGGLGGLNTAGAKWGTGYCDAQCFTTPFINGQPNLEGHGACCHEMDIWEANRMATSIAPHVCAEDGLFTCEGAECDFNGVCDEWGCQFNTYRNGDKTFYGNGSDFEVDTTRPFRVVTQFPTDDEGNLIAIRRFYIQDGNIIHMPDVDLPGVPAIDHLTDELCEAIDQNRYVDLGGMKAMGDAMARGMVLVMSVWWSEGDFMKWLDQGERGPCNATEGDPKVIVRIESDPMVRYSNIRWGEMDSTYQQTGCRRRI